MTPGDHERVLDPGLEQVCELMPAPSPNCGEGDETQGRVVCSEANGVEALTTTVELEPHFALHKVTTESPRAVDDAAIAALIDTHFAAELVRPGREQAEQSRFIARGR